MTPLTLLSLAERSVHDGRFSAALRALDRAAKLARDPFLLAEIHSLEAEALRALGRFAPALDAFWKSHKQYRRVGADFERLRTLVGASGCLRVLGRYKQARAMWDSVSGTFGMRTRNLLREEVWLERAIVFRGLGRHSEARAILVKLKKTQETSWALAGTERFLGNFRPALKAFGEAARLARQNGDARGEAYAWCGEAACHRILGNARPALEKYREAYKIFVREKDPFGTAYGLCGMGNAHRVYGNARKCLPLYKKSFNLYMKLGDEGSAGFALWGLGGAYRRLGDSVRADRMYRRALRHFRKDGDARGSAMALLGLKKLSAARREAARHKLGYEAALADYLAAGRTAVLGRFGITKKTASLWKDVP